MSKTHPGDVSNREILELFQRRCEETIAMMKSITEEWRQQNEELRSQWRKYGQE